MPGSSDATKQLACHAQDVATITCLIVDDNELFLRAAKVLLEREGLIVLGVASTIDEAVRQVWGPSSRCRPRRHLPRRGERARPGPAAVEDVSRRQPDAHPDLDALRTRGGGTDRVERGRRLLVKGGAVGDRGSNVVAALGR
jgi:hypothetical protein